MIINQKIFNDISFTIIHSCLEIDLAYSTKSLDPHPDDSPATIAVPAISK